MIYVFRIPRHVITKFQTLFCFLIHLHSNASPVLPIGQIISKIFQIHPRMCDTLIHQKSVIFDKQFFHACLFVCYGCQYGI